MDKAVIGILAHVDAGKTTLSEALLYLSGAIRRLGRVDDKDTFLDHFALERERGITIFSKQANLHWGESTLILLDTPGHVDFSAETERTLQVLDAAVLVISGADGVQAHTRTLWRLLERYRVPVFLFINKMDQAGTDRELLLHQLQGEFGSACVDCSAGRDASFLEEVAMCQEAALESYLAHGTLTAAEIAGLVADRQLYPCYFGSALRLKGVKELLDGLVEYLPRKSWPEEFGARVFKIARDPQGNRLTYLKVTGGTLRVKSLLEEKINQIRIYSGEKYELVQEAAAGSVCAVTGPVHTAPGEGLGFEAAREAPLLVPVLSYRLVLPSDCDPVAFLGRLRQLEEEEPQLHVVWQEQTRDIYVRVMGQVQLEILAGLIRERYGVAVSFDAGRIVYKETIAAPVEGVGHFEPLRHYAEVHLLLEPAEPGSGLTYASAVGTDQLERSWQRLVLTHLQEKEHVGVLTGSAITDMKITLIAGRAHIKHTEGGDFRQATYRALRQGLMQADCILLEPCYSFRLELPERLVGRGMADIEKMHGSFRPPVTENGRAVLTGTAPVATMREYQREVTAYSRGEGRLSCVLKGYEPCHNSEEVMAASGYDPLRDTMNPSESVFCSHGAGFVVPWDQVREYMHLPGADELLAGARSGSIGEDAAAGEAGRMGSGAQRMSRRESAATRQREVWLGTQEVDAILKGTYRSKKRDGGKAAGRGWNHRIWDERGEIAQENTGEARSLAETSPSVKGDRENPDRAGGEAGGSRTAAPRNGNPRQTERAKKGERQRDPYLLVDGYNVIFAWEELRSLAEQSVDAARGRLQDILCNYQGIRGMQIIVVFDAYRVQGQGTKLLDYHNIHVVYTKEAETADQYIEKFTHENGKKYDITVATSDGLEQVIILGAGCRLLSARELQEEVELASSTLREEYLSGQPQGRQYLLDQADDEVKKTLKKME